MTDDDDDDDVFTHVINFFRRQANHNKLEKLILFLVDQRVKQLRREIGSGFSKLVYCAKTTAEYET